MIKIDSHQHFWIYDPIKDAWIDDTMPMLKRNFLPEEVFLQMQSAGIDACVAVQADQSEEETLLLLQLAEQNSFIKAVVGWVDLTAENIKERLHHFSAFKKLKGFRHIIQSEKDEKFILSPTFCNGIAALADYGFTYDILIYPNHIRYAYELVRKFPSQRFVINHLAKPFIKEKKWMGWYEDLSRFRFAENVYCKLAGLVTLGDWSAWKLTDFTIYVNKVLDIFGDERVMFGSDWPVCLTGASYQQTVDIAEALTDHLSAAEKENIWAKNCNTFYNVNL